MVTYAPRHSAVVVNRPLRVIIFGGLINRLGNGLVMPFTVIYLHNTRGIDLTVTGTLLGLFGIAGLLITPPAGSLIDRIGSVRTLAVALGLLALGYGGLAFVTGPLSAGTALAVAGAGNGMFWPSHKALLASLAPPGRRHVAFSSDQLAGNVGLGIGALSGGLLIGANQTATAYPMLFLANAATYIVFILLLWFGPAAMAGRRAQPGGPPQPGGTETGGAASGGWLAVLRHTALRRLLTVQLIVVTCGVVGMEQLFPVYLRNFAGVPAATIGVVFAVNVVTYLLVQVPIRRKLEGRGRATSLSWGINLWAGLWLAIALAAWLSSGLVVVVVACVVSALFAVGESVFSLTVDPTVSDVAPEHLLGRFLSALTLIWNIGLIFGPVIGTWIMDVRPAALWPAFAGALLVAGTQARRLRSALPESRQTI